MGRKKDSSDEYEPLDEQEAESDSEQQHKQAPGICRFELEIGRILMEHILIICRELPKLQIMYICSIRICLNLYLKKEHASFDARSMHVCAIVPPPCPGPPFRDSLALAF